jgi:MFS family permease
VTKSSTVIRRTFSSLGIRNYRLYFIGQSVSLSGTWIQRVAQAWLVLEITKSGTAVGALAATHFLPILLFAPVGGLIADRVDRRRLLYVTQSIAAFSAICLGSLVLIDEVELWMVFILTFVLGLATSIDAPARQTFVFEMVGRSQLSNAVSLNSSLVNAARVVGPSLAGILIGTVGLGWCFQINALSHVALIIALVRMHDLPPTARGTRSRKQLREGFRYVRSNPDVMGPLALMAVIGIFAWEYEVILPLMAQRTFNGDARTFSLMMAAMGFGAVMGGLFTASRLNHSASALTRTAAAFGGVQIVVSLAPTLLVTLIGLVALGVVSIAFVSLSNSSLQLASAPEMRGRVIGLYIVAFAGSTPLGGPLMGWIGDQLSPRWALGLGGVPVILAAILLKPILRAVTSVRQRPQTTLDGPADSNGEVHVHPIPQSRQGESCANQRP